MDFTNYARQQVSPIIIPLSIFGSVFVQPGHNISLCSGILISFKLKNQYSLLNFPTLPLPLLYISIFIFNGRIFHIHSNSIYTISISLPSVCKFPCSAKTRHFKKRALPFLQGFSTFLTLRMLFSNFSFNTLARPLQQIMFCYASSNYKSWLRNCQLLANLKT